MSATASIQSDSELLARYLREGCEASFAALVTAHQAMVLGTALRRTGDVELARDVAQQVFTLLARKAAWLAGRDSLAGWLHRAACYLGARAVRSEARTRARHEALARESATRPRDTELWSMLDDGLAALGAKEREALVLHYFEDRSYPEMAALLGIGEAAARQRVSRALRGLGARLRRRGSTASAAALLAGGTALQTTVPAQAGLAAAALSTGGASAPVWLIVTTLMSHTAAKIALATLVLAALPVAVLHQEHTRLLAATAPDSLIPRSSAEAPPRTASSAPSGDLLAAWDRFRAEQTRRMQAEEKLASLQREIERVETEVVVSYGQVEDLARKLAAKARQLRRFEDLHKLSDPVERERLARELAAQTSDLSDFFVIAREAQKMESEPEKAGRFYATMLGELAGLDEAAREPLARVARERFAAMWRAGVIAARRPAEEDAAWQEARRHAFAELDAALLAALPPEKREEGKSFSSLIDFSDGGFFPMPAPAEGTK